MAAAVFRDPVELEARAGALRLEIARALVGAPALPVELRAFDLTLLSVAAERGAVDLILGKSAPIVRLRLSSADTGERGSHLPAARARRRPAVQVATVELHPSAERFRRQLAVMSNRLRAAITREKWEAARDAARRLAGIPAGVPLAFYRQLVPGTPGQGLVRTGFHCNQDCGMCWQDRAWGRFGPEQTLVWIEDLFAAGARRLTISGGEPTLDPMLESYIRHARSLGYQWVTLETNAIQFARPGLAERLREAGLGDCFVSLHSGDPATSDAITRAPGTFQRTVAGIKRLLAARVMVRLNCVLTREGIDHLEGVPDFVHESFGASPYLEALMFSQPCDPFDPALAPAVIPEPDRLRAVLRKVIDRAFALGLPIRGLDGPCGPPLCAFGADRRLAALTPIPEMLDGRTYLPACDGCAVRRACFGVRTADAKLYGDACVLPLVSEPAA